jgi:hypothetical protein
MKSTAQLTFRNRRQRPASLDFMISARRKRAEALTVIEFFRSSPEPFVNL